ncbi:MAG: DUF2160 domain-containing protein [Gammaproteobacteria bacterium]|nr:DUF2160 domain-containing protein [Gammaproteobacteria bacterium]
MSWMAWTPITVAFFSVIAVMLLAMTIYEIKVPCTERKGFLPISTTRGDRFFIGLLTSAYIHLAFLAVSDMTLLIPLVVSAIWLPVVLRWG